MVAREAVLLFALEAVDAPLHLPPAEQVEQVPAGLQVAVDVRGRLGHQREAVGELRGEGRRDDGLAGARAAGEDDARGEEVTRTED